MLVFGEFYRKEFQTRNFSENLAAAVIDPGIYGSVGRNYGH
jgi:hypothetical protein